MVVIKPKTTVTMRMAGAGTSHSRTDVSVRDVESTIDEPVERGGTNMGLSPTETLMAALLPALFAGSVFIETIFTLPGMGFLAVQSVVSRDFPTMMAIFTISSFLSLIGILISDLFLKVVDPRITFGGRTA